MDKQASPVRGISLQSSEISVDGMKIFPCKHSSAGLARLSTGMKNVEMRVRRRKYVIDLNARNNSSRQPS